MDGARAPAAAIGEGARVKLKDVKTGGGNPCGVDGPAIHTHIRNGADPSQGDLTILYVSVRPQGEYAGAEVSEGAYACWRTGRKPLRYRGIRRSEPAGLRRSVRVACLRTCVERTGRKPLRYRGIRRSEPAGLRRSVRVACLRTCVERIGMVLRRFKHPPALCG